LLERSSLEKLNTFFYIVVKNDNDDVYSGVTDVVFNRFPGGEVDDKEKSGTATRFAVSLDNE
jgi:hypothetical protein